MKRSTKADLAREFRKKNPDTPSRQLGRMLYKKHPLLFKDDEHARAIIRYIEGKSSGGNKTKKVIESEYYREEARPYNPYKLPEPDTKDLEPYVLPRAFNRFILAGDFHVPNHRNEPITAMLDYAKENNIRKLFINGDLLDNTPFTRWMREPLDKGDVKLWFDMARAMLVLFKEYFDEIYWLEGNHDFWYTRYLMEKAKELFGDDYFRLENRLDLASLGIKYIEQKYLVKAGHLNITHGHILFRGGGSYANAARMLYMKTKSNTIASHVHVESSHTEPDLNDKIVTTFTTGCMCTLRPEYQPYGGKACHGFADITIHKNRDFNVKNLRIYKGKIL